MRLIDADSLKTKLRDPTRRAFALEIIDNEPTADPFQIVRCKECKYGEEDSTGVLYCKAIGYQVGLNDFCNYGERREDGHD